MSSFISIMKFSDIPGLIYYISYIFTVKTVGTVIPKDELEVSTKVKSHLIKTVAAKDQTPATYRLANTLFQLYTN